MLAAIMINWSSGLTIIDQKNAIFTMMEELHLWQSVRKWRWRWLKSRIYLGLWRKHLIKKFWQPPSWPVKLHCCDTTEVNEEVCSNYSRARNWRLETELSEALQLNCKADFSETGVVFTLVLISQSNQLTQTSSSPHWAAGPFPDHFKQYCV